MKKGCVVLWQEEKMVMAPKHFAEKCTECIVMEAKIMLYVSYPVYLPMQYLVFVHTANFKMTYMKVVLCFWFTQILPLCLYETVARLNQFFNVLGRP